VPDEAAASPRFGRDARLRRKAEFAAVQDGGRRVAGRYLVLLARASDRAADRLGVVASRRVGSAVRRNRAKRRLREIFRRRPAGEVAPALDLVAIAKSELATAPFALVEREFQSALRRLRGSR
jgi:ribonuclease P protein component